MKKSFLILFFVPMLAIGQPISFNTFSEADVPAKVPSITKENPVKTNELSKYTGHYKSELIADFEIDVFMEGGLLYGIRKGDSERVEISPVSPSKFLVKGPQVQIQFLEEQGEVQFMMVAKDEVMWLVKVK